MFFFFSLMLTMFCSCSVFVCDDVLLLFQTDARRDKMKTDMSFFLETGPVSSIHMRTHKYSEGICGLTRSFFLIFSRLFIFSIVLSLCSFSYLCFLHVPRVCVCVL